MNTRAPVADWRTDFDHFDPRFSEDPYPIFADLRRTCPVAHTQRFEGLYLPTRYDDIRQITADTEHFSSRRLFARDKKPPLVRVPPITSDPPDHRGERKVLLPAFTPQAIRKLEPHMRQTCRSLAEKASRQEHCDGAVDYAQEIPVAIIAHMMGLSPDDGELFRRWIHELIVESVLRPEIIPRVQGEINGFFLREIAARRAAPGEDLISFLLDARIEEEALADGQIAAMLQLLLVAGIDTTWSAIGTSLWHLATHDEDRRRLAADPAAIPRAVEEFLRAYAPVTMGRLVVKPVEIGGCPFAEGEMVLLPFAAANRDPDAFDEPDRVDIGREKNPHAAFGLGIHRCIGSHLARMEITVALEEWLAQVPEFTLRPGAAVVWSQGQIRGPRTLPLRTAGFQLASG